MAETSPTSDLAGQFEALMRRLAERAPVPLDPQDFEFLRSARDRLFHLEEQSRRFLEAGAIEEIAERKAIQVMESAGFDMKDLRRTNGQVQWLMGLKQGLKGLFIGALTVIGGVVGTIFATFVSTRWIK